MPSLLASETTLFIQLEAIKNSVKTQGYSKEIHDQLMELYEAHKQGLSTYSDSQLKQEFVGLVRSSHLVQGLKTCVDTGHDDINLGIDALFNTIIDGDCVRKVMTDSTIEAFIADTQKILDVSNPSQRPEIEDVRKDLFDSSLPGLLQSFNNTRNLFSDTEERFFKNSDELFNRLPENKRALLPPANKSSQSTQDVSKNLLGPIDDLFKAAYGDRAELAMNDQWGQVHYLQDDKQNTPHLFGPDLRDMSPEGAQNSVEECLKKANEIKALQEAAKERYGQLRGLVTANSLGSLIPTDERADRPYEELGLAATPECYLADRGLVGHSVEHRTTPLTSEDLKNPEQLQYQLSYSGKSVALSIGKLGEDPVHGARTFKSDNLENRSFLGNYTPTSIKERQTKALEGMQDFVNYMGRRAMMGVTLGQEPRP